METVGRNSYVVLQVSVTYPHKGMKAPATERRTSFCSPPGIFTRRKGFRSLRSLVFFVSQEELLGTGVQKYLSEKTFMTRISVD
jgi:hypothetical protein